MGDQVIDIHQPLLTSQGDDEGSGIDVEATIQDLCDAMNVMEEKDPTNNNNNKGVKNPEEEEAAEKIECRICQQDDSLSLLEAPCHCNGTLKYAHRVCVQHWCAVKGDTTCEICHQPFQPNYVAVTPFPNGTTINPRARGRTLSSGVSSPQLAEDTRGRLTHFVNEETNLGNLIFAIQIILYCLGFYVLLLAIVVGGAVIYLKI